MQQTKTPTEYRVDDQELLLDVYKKLMWNRLVPKIPASIAPNTITILGQVAAMLVVVTSYAAVVAGMPLLYPVSALLLLAYLTADNVDGAHARRTGQASPLGEFLDHGLDGLASGAVLVTTCLVLRVDGVAMVLLCALGALGFLLLFWEQFRTGLLVIPKVSSTEGVTFLMVIQLSMWLLGDPAYLHFSMTEVNVATVIIGIVLVGYAAAMAPPIVRALGRNVSPLELLGPASLAAACVAFAVLGAEALIPAVAVSVLGAEVVCRMIVLRHRGQEGPILTRWHALIALPLVGALAAPDAWTVTGWATLSMFTTVTLYAITLVRGASTLIAGSEATA